MCILFFCQNEICHPDGYQLVLVNNRDEAWERPTKEAHFWGDKQECISGVDQMQGRVGGTWLGMSRTGRIAVVLSILGQQDLTKRGKGFLVKDFIAGKDDISDYTNKVLAEKDLYNGFNLVLFDLGKQEDSFTVKPVYVSNAHNYLSCIFTRSLPANTFFGVSNSPLEFPFQKVEKGKLLFGKILSQYPTVGLKEHLVENLLNFMSCQTPCLPDPVLEKAANSVGYSASRIRQQSAINVWYPEGTYGTRAISIILIDGQGKVDYIEQTIEPKLNDSPEKITRHNCFDLTKDRKLLEQATFVGYNNLDKSLS